MRHEERRGEERRCGEVTRGEMNLTLGKMDVIPT